MANLSLEFAPFISYMNTYWIQHVGPEFLSVHGCPRRTNNDVESFHSQLHTLSGKRSHPSLWDFIRILVDMNRNVTLKLLTHERGGKHSCSQRKSAKLQDRQIRTAEASLFYGAYTVGEFLEAVSYSVSTLEKTLRSRVAASLPIPGNEIVEDPHPV